MMMGRSTYKYAQLQRTWIRKRKVKACWQHFTMHSWATPMRYYRHTSGMVQYIPVNSTFKKLFSRIAVFWRFWRWAFLKGWVGTLHDFAGLAKKLAGKQRQNEKKLDVLWDQQKAFFSKDMHANCFSYFGSCICMSRKKTWKFAERCAQTFFY